MTTHHRDIDHGQTTEEISSNIYISLAAILLILCSVGLYAYPRDRHMIVTATNAIDQIEPLSKAAPDPAR